MELRALGNRGVSVTASWLIKSQDLTSQSCRLFASPPSAMECFNQNKGRWLGVPGSPGTKAGEL